MTMEVIGLVLGVIVLGELTAKYVFGVKSAALETASLIAAVGLVALAADHFGYLKIG